LYFSYLWFHNIYIGSYCYLLSFFFISENEISELRQKYISLSTNFQQKKLIAMKYARLTDIILKSQESLDANIVNLTFDVSFFKYIIYLCIILFINIYICR